MHATCIELKNAIDIEFRAAGELDLTSSLSLQEIVTFLMNSSNFSLWKAEDNEEMLKKSFLIFERSFLEMLKKDKGK